MFFNINQPRVPFLAPEAMDIFKEFHRFAISRLKLDNPGSCEVLFFRPSADSSPGQCGPRDRSVFKGDFSPEELNYQHHSHDLYIAVLGVALPMLLPVYAHELKHAEQWSNGTIKASRSQMFVDVPADERHMFNEMIEKEADIFGIKTFLDFLHQAPAEYHRYLADPNISITQADSMSFEDQIEAVFWVDNNTPLLRAITRTVLTKQYGREAMQLLDTWIEAGKVPGVEPAEKRTTEVFDLGKDIAEIFESLGGAHVQVVDLSGDMSQLHFERKDKIKIH
jgi:hypothetical protein